MLRIISLIFLAVLLAGCQPSGGASSSRTPVSQAPSKQAVTPAPDEAPEEPSDYNPRPGDEALTRGPVYIEASHVYALEGFPPRFSLYISGALPTPCHTLRAAVAAPAAAGHITIETYSLAEPGKMCAQVLKHFEANISLKGIPAGQYSVWLNDAKVGDIVVPASENEAAPQEWELYSWEEDGVLTFALLEGSDPERSLEVILAPENRLGSVAAVKERLGQLQRGDTIAWRALDDPTGKLPGKAEQQGLLAHAQDLGLMLQIWLPPVDETALKGWELYSWQEGGAWQYALLVGTNRIKTWEEVIASEVRLKDLTALKLALSQLAPGERVFWQPGEFTETSFPADAVVAEVQRYAEELGLILQVIMLR